MDQGPAGVQWQRTLWAMVAIQFINTMAFSVLSPIMPLFLPVLGVESASGVAFWAGILNGITSFVAAFVSPLWGRVADRRGRKLMLIRSTLAIGGFTALMGIAANIWQFFAFRALMGAFAGFSSAAIALVASQVSEGGLGFALGLLSTGQLVGSLVGPLIGGALADLTGSYRIPFYCTSAKMLMSSGLVWLTVRESFVAPPQTRGGRSILGSLIAVASLPGLPALFFVLLMAQFGVRTLQPVVTLFVQELVGARPGSRDPERHRLLGDRDFQCHRGTLSRQPQRRDRLSPGLADLSVGGGPDDPAAGFHRQLLDLHAQRLP